MFWLFVPCVYSTLRCSPQWNSGMRLLKRLVTTTTLGSEGLPKLGMFLIQAMGLCSSPYHYCDFCSHCSHYSSPSFKIKMFILKNSKCTPESDATGFVGEDNRAQKLLNRSLFLRSSKSPAESKKTLREHYSAEEIKGKIFVRIKGSQSPTCLLCLWKISPKTLFYSKLKYFYIYIFL